MPEPIAARSQPRSAPLADAAAPQEWVSAHAFYSGNLDPLLTGTVDPLVGELTARSLIDGFFFVRYWDGGPHLRLRCRATPGSSATVKREMRQRIARFLRDRPSPGPHHAGYATHAAQLARLEQVADYHREPLPPNTVWFFPYRREHDRYGTGSTIAAVERHFAQCSRVVLSWLVNGLSPTERSTAALAIILLAWCCAGVDPSAAQRMIDAAGPSPDASTTGTAGYHRQRDTLHQLARRMRTLAARAGELTGAGDLPTWARSATALHNTLQRTGDGPDPFHVLDRCAHLACNRLGVAIDEEQHLRHLAGLALAAPAGPTVPVGLTATGGSPDRTVSPARSRP